MESTRLECQDDEGKEEDFQDHEDQRLRGKCLDDIVEPDWQDGRVERLREKWGNAVGGNFRQKHTSEGKAGWE